MDLSPPSTRGPAISNCRVLASEATRPIGVSEALSGDHAGRSTVSVALERSCQWNGVRQENAGALGVGPSPHANPLPIPTRGSCPLVPRAIALGRAHTTLRQSPTPRSSGLHPWLPGPAYQKYSARATRVGKGRKRGVSAPLYPRQPWEKKNPRLPIFSSVRTHLPAKWTKSSIPRPSEHHLNSVARKTPLRGKTR